jgi:hypothetical protein
LIEEIRRVAELVDKPVLTMPDYERNARIAGSTIKRRFGDWLTALERAGVGHMYPESHRVWQSDEALLEEVRRVAKVAGKAMLTGECFDRHSRVSARTLYRRFGNWLNVLERAGIGHMYSAVVVGPGRTLK